MQKLLALFSSAICLFVTSTVYSNQCDNKYVYANTYGHYTGQDLVETPCMGQCSNPGRFYVGAFGGANWLHFHKEREKAKLGYTGGVSFGYKWNEGLRLEGEVAYRQNHLRARHIGYDNTQRSLINGRSHSWAYMVNGLYDFNSVSCHIPHVVPYIGVGVGYARNHIRYKYQNQDDFSYVYQARHKGMAYQAIAGLNYLLTDDTSMGIEYRYFDGKKDMKDQSAVLTLRRSI